MDAQEWIIYIADLFGTGVFAVTGAVKAIARKLDFFGVIVLGCCVGIGGGTLRDMAIGATPAASFSNSSYLLLCIVISVAVFMLPRRLLRGYPALIVHLDALGLGVFTALGNAKAEQYGLPPITIVLSGVITAVGGGVIRDVLVSSVPQVLKSDFYATAALLGGIIYILLGRSGIAFFPQFFLVVVAVTAIRIIAYHRKIQLPKYRPRRIQR